MGHQAEDEAQRSGRNYDAAVEEVRRAQAAVDRIGNDVWRWHWAIPYAIAVSWAESVRA